MFLLWPRYTSGQIPALITVSALHALVLLSACAPTDQSLIVQQERGCVALSPDRILTTLPDGCEQHLLSTDRDGVLTGVAWFPLSGDEGAVLYPDVAEQDMEEGSLIPIAICPGNEEVAGILTFAFQTCTTSIVIEETS